MIRIKRHLAISIQSSAVSLFFILILQCSVAAPEQSSPSSPARAFYIDCSLSATGDGSRAHPWNRLPGAQSHRFAAGDRIALARTSTCHDSFSPQGSGDKDNPIRLTAYGRGPRPRIVAAATDRQVLLLFNQEYWQVDSLDLSGANKYGIFVSGDHGTLHGISLKNLYVHDVQGGELKNKDNGLVIVGPSGPNTFFNDVLVDGVVAAHTNQWAGILIGGGNYGYKDDSPLNTHIAIRNSSVQDVFGDGIILFRISGGLIETSSAWQTGMQPTETTGTPNAIWTWTCTDCIVRDNEAFLTDSPGVDGGAYDIDWDNTRNTVERNYAHDTQGYCFAVFAAGYVTRDSVVRDNLCIDNGLSPRLAALQGAVYLHGWNGGVIRGLRMEHNTLFWNPPVSSAPALISDADFGNGAAVFAGNRLESSSQFFYRTNRQFAPAGNTYLYSGPHVPRFTLGDRHDATLAALQSAGVEAGTTLSTLDIAHPSALFLRLDATVDCTLDADGLLAPGPRAQLMVLRSLAAQYGPATLAVTAHLHTPAGASAEEAIANALLDLDADSIRFDRDAKQPGLIQLLEANGSLIHSWQGFQNAATLGLAVRAKLGAPRYAAMPSKMTAEDLK